MNLELLECFGHNYPEEPDTTLDCVTIALTCEFNRFGTLLAVGCNDGRIVIWDFLTRGIAKIIQAHVHPVCSLSWCRSGRRLVSASTDNNVSVWDVLSGDCMHRFRLPTPVLQVQFDPRDQHVVMVVPIKHAPLLIFLAPTSNNTDNSNSPDKTDHQQDIKPQNSTGNSFVILPLDDENDFHITASYDHRGEYIYMGNSRGKMLVIKALKWKKVDEFLKKQNSSKGGGGKDDSSKSNGNSKDEISMISNAAVKPQTLSEKVGLVSLVEVVGSFRVVAGSTSTASSTLENTPISSSASSCIKGIEFSRRCKSFLVNTADRVIRLFRISAVFEAMKCGKDPECDQKLQDLVNKTVWKRCCFSGDGEYVCAGSARQHSLYIWERGAGTLMKILHGTKGEILLDVVWHPVRPIVASISQGVVTVWSQQQVENWSAFAPDFKELDENVEYEERESEFDMEDEDKEIAERLMKEGQGEDDCGGVEDVLNDSHVDVDTQQPIVAYCSSDEDDINENDDDIQDNKMSQALLYLPIAPEIEDPEDHFVPGLAGGISGGGGVCGDDAVGTGSDGTALGGASSKENTSPVGGAGGSSRKRRPKTTDVVLPKALKDENHPLVAKGSKDKAPMTKRNQSRQKGKGDKSKLK